MPREGAGDFEVLDGLGPRGTREAGEWLLALAGELGCGVLVAASDLDALLVAHRVLCFESASRSSRSSRLRFAVHAQGTPLDRSKVTKRTPR
jgi:hypothetical protein